MAFYDRQTRAPGLFAGPNWGLTSFDPSHPDPGDPSHARRSCERPIDKAGLETGAPSGGFDIACLLR